MSRPEDVVLDLMYGRWRSQTMYAGVTLGMFEVVGQQARPSAAIAGELALDPDLAYRLLRALASLSLLEEHANRNFSITPAGQFLQKAHPQSLRDMFLLREGPEHTALWKQLPAIVRDGVQNGFVREFGSPAFEYAALAPAYARAFDAGMSSHSRLQTEWVLEALREYDFSSITRLCDVGGGQGHLLGHLLLNRPHLLGILMERASVIADRPALWPERLGVGQRCQYVAGDMFASVPSAEAYSLKMILHDWNDAECVQILSNLRQQAPASGRVFIAEHVITDAQRGQYAALFDMHMLVWGTGRERTVDEYASLLRRSGWAYVSTRFPTNGIMGVIEGHLD